MLTILGLYGVCRWLSVRSLQTTTFSCINERDLEKRSSRVCYDADL